jgi:hypothetical protein
MSLLTRIMFTIIIMIMSSAATAIYSPYAGLMTGKAAGGQMIPSDVGYLASSYTMSLYSGLGAMIWIPTLIVLVLLWIRPVGDLINSMIKDDKTPLIMLAILVPFLWVSDARAYYDKTDYTEAYSILPNETAIYVPSVGNNKDSQVKLDSEEYLKANQVSSKLFIIPHMKLSGSGSYIGWGDFYVPAGRLFIVDRTTYSHEWVQKGRGSNPTVDESIPCQSKEGLDITVGVAVGTKVLEEDAAKYLYNFNVMIDPKVNRTDPVIIFQSVYWSRRVADVMGDIGRKKIQTLVCNEISSRNFDQANIEAPKIMEIVEAKAREYFKSVGITLTFIGWADTFTFDSVVQKAVNDRYVVDKLGASLAVLNAIANIKVQEGLGQGLEKHGLPIVVTPDMLNVLSGLAAKAPAPVTNVPGK